LFDWREINRTGWLDLRTSCVQARWIYCQTVKKGGPKYLDRRADR